MTITRLDPVPPSESRANKAPGAAAISPLIHSFLEKAEFENQGPPHPRSSPNRRVDQARRLDIYKTTS